MGPPTSFRTTCPLLHGTLLEPRDRSKPVGLRAWGKMQIAFESNNHSQVSKFLDPSWYPLSIPGSSQNASLAVLHARLKEPQAATMLLRPEIRIHSLKLRPSLSHEAPNRSPQNEGRMNLAHVMFKTTKKTVCFAFLHKHNGNRVPTLEHFEYMFKQVCPPQLVFPSHSEHNNYYRYPCRPLKLQGRRLEPIPQVSSPSHRLLVQRASWSLLKRSIKSQYIKS